jgi:predicted DCC family thiol-disulfide oxidoreductase YuxK
VAAQPQTIPNLSKASPGKLAALIDGTCAMCQAAGAAIRKFDTANRIEILDLHDPDARARFPELKMEHLVEELHVVDDGGRIYRGARAVNELLRYQNGIKRMLAYLWYVPGYAWFADRQYKRIAASRYQRDSSGRVKASA